LLERWIKRYLLQGRFTILQLLPQLSVSYTQLFTFVAAKKANNSIEQVLGKIDKKESALIIPEKVNFPCFDFMLYLTSQPAEESEQRFAKEPVIVFIQTTISKVDEHNYHDSDINLLMKPDGVAIRALDTVFKAKHKAEIVVVHGHSDKQKTHRITFKDAKGKKRDVYYVYASGCDIDQEASSSVDKYENVIVLSQRYLQEQWQIVF